MNARSGGSYTREKTVAFKGQSCYIDPELIRNAMIQCPVCRAENDDFAITCSECKGFIQDRVPNLNLFETGWTVLESPHKAFRTITLAEHKNYVLFLFTLFGISLSFTGFWLFRLGRYFDNLLDLIGSALSAGIVLGLAAAVFETLTYHGIA